MLKDLWTDKIDGENYVMAEDINLIAHSAMDLEEEVPEIEQKAKKYTDDAEKNAKDYAYSLIDKPYIPKACTATDNVEWAFEICKSPKSTDGITLFNYSNNWFVIVVDAEPLLDVDVIFYNPLTGNKILCKNTGYILNRDGTYELEFVVKDEFVLEATTLEKFKQMYFYFGEYVGEYKWKKNNYIDKKYVDTSIQQAILDSWEVGV